MGIHTSLLHCFAFQYASCSAQYGCRSDSYYTAQCESVCVCLTPHCGLRVLRGNSGKCRGSTCLRQTFLSLAQTHIEIERALCPVVSTTCLLAILILFKESKQPGVQGVAQSWCLSKNEHKILFYKIYFLKDILGFGQNRYKIGIKFCHCFFYSYH